MEKINKIAESLIIKKSIIISNNNVRIFETSTSKAKQAKNRKLLNEQNCDCFVFPECVELPY